MKIELHPAFRKSYKTRIAKNKKLVRQVAERLKLFQENPKDPSLRDHALIGRKRYLRAFSVTGDIRIVYFPITKDQILLLDIGTHNQVY